MKNQTQNFINTKGEIRINNGNQNFLTRSSLSTNNGIIAGAGYTIEISTTAEIPYPLYSLVQFRMEHEFEWVATGSPLTNLPNYGDIVSYSNIRSITADQDGLVLISDQGRVIAELEAGKTLYNPSPEKIFYIGAKKSWYNLSPRPRVQIEFNYTTTTDYYRSVVSGKYTVIEEN